MQVVEAEPLLKLTDAARAAGLSIYALRRLVTSRKVACCRVGSVRRVRLSAIKEAITEIPAAPRI